MSLIANEARDVRVKHNRYKDGKEESHRKSRAFADELVAGLTVVSQLLRAMLWTGSAAGAPKERLVGLLHLRHALALMRLGTKVC